MVMQLEISYDFRSQREAIKSFIERKERGKILLLKINAEDEEEILAILKEIITQRQYPTELFFQQKGVRRSFLEKILHEIEGNPHFPQIELDTSNLDFDPTRAISLVSNILARPTCTLKNLTWSFKRTEPAHFLLLSQALKQNSSLVQLKLAAHCLHPSDFRNLIDIFQFFISSKGNSIKSLHLKNFTASEDDQKAVDAFKLALKTNTHIQQLIFTAKEELSEKIITSLKDSEGLTSLAIHSTTTTFLFMDWKLLAINLPPHLQELEISSRGDAENFLKDIIYFLGECKQSFHLKVGVNSLHPNVSSSDKKKFEELIKPILIEKNISFESDFLFKEEYLYKRNVQATFFTVLAQAKKQEFNEGKRSHIELGMS
ncbi:Uncharacterised protein [Fluoribacter dumoffii]|uniref:Uncharacterized protein n=2 Tax=Fluoribacter dumoffii TaxID=463 RepID=A0A377G7S1_9GAMM|nr:hypothetical protein Ldum_0178 [Fluoribacter dumoffii NY 23]STO20398.1 Uncharacterised protein [Fluoribacter dumoffii]